MAALRTHLTYANVMATLAVFGVLAGTAWAIGANTVGTRQLKPKAVRTSDLAPNAVTSPKVKNGSLRRGDFAAGQIPAGATGPTGPQGPQGIQGPTALRLDYDMTELDNIFRTIGIQDDLTIKARCRQVSAQAELQIQLRSGVPAEYNYFLSEDQGVTPELINNGGSISANTDTLVFGLLSGSGGFRRAEGQIIYRNATRTTSIQLHAIADDLSDTCRIHGIAVPAS